jgi:hypothetical protein
MAMQSIYEVLKEKEAQLHELQRLLNEAQSVLGRVLELDALSGNESPAARPAGSSNGLELRASRANGQWGGNGAVEFP